MFAFVTSVVVFAGSSSIALRALDTGDAGTASASFAMAALAALVVARSFKRGVFGGMPKGEPS